MNVSTRSSTVFLVSWQQMNQQTRHRVSELAETMISAKPGVYALYREGDAVYVGKATSLQSRLWGNHFRKGVSMTNSALRRNVAQHLAIAAAADIKARRYQPTAADALRVSDWIRECDVAWIDCDTEAAAVVLEGALKLERKPPLTKV